MSGKAYLIFDLDDTILDFKKGEHEGLNKIYANNLIPNVQFDQWFPVFKRVNSEVWRQIEAGGSVKELLDTRFSKTYQEFGMGIDGKIFEQEYRNHLDQNYYVLEGAKELIEKLKQQNFTVIAGTNGNSSTQRSRLKGTELESVFDDIVISDEIGYAKPNKQFFNIMIERNEGMTPENTIMIGDSLRSDIQGAINAGITNIWFNPFGIENNTEIKPDFEASTFEEVETFIQSMIFDQAANQ